MLIWLIWNGEAVPEDRGIVEIFSDERIAYEFVTGGECARQGYPDATTDDIECCSVCETVAESHDGYVEVLREKMIRGMSDNEREAMRVGWDKGLDIETTEERGTDEKGERMKEIWEWSIPIVGAGSFTLQVPENAQFLTCQVQGKTPVLWAVVRTTAKEREYKFHVFGTGEQFELHDDLTYIGTFQLVGGAFVGHLFVQGAVKL